METTEKASTEESGQGLRELRVEVAGITRQIIDLISKRNDLARKIGEVKTRAALPQEDEKVESGLMEDVLRECSRKGVDPEVGLKVLNTLLSESKRVQGQQAKKKVLVTPMMMMAKALQIESSGRKLVRLDVGEPDFHPPEAVLDATSAALYGFRTHYTATRGIPELLTSLRGYLKRRQEYSAKDTEVMATPGGRFGVYLALASTVKEGESAVIIEPNWPAYKEALQYIGAKAQVVPTTLEEGWEPSIESIERAIRPNTRAIVLSYPANPTGKIISPDRFDEIVRLAAKYGLTVISDEIYTDYAYVPCPSILKSSVRDKFILTASFSKTWAMTGFRVGYSVSSEEMISRMMKIQSLLVTSVPEFIQVGAVKALENSDRELEENARAMRQRIDAAAAELDKISGLSYYRPDGAMYVFPQARDASFDSAAFAMTLVEGRGVTVSPGTGFGDYPRCFRISLGQSRETIVEGIRLIGESMN